MDSKTYSIPHLTEVWARVAGVLRPTSTADMIALAIAIVATGIYQLQGILWDRPDPHKYVFFERPQQKGGAIVSQRQAQRNIAKELTESGKRAVVFWGSQSGTAERFAHQLAKGCQQRFGMGALAADLSDYDAESIAELSKDQLAIFILSTYGEGDPTDNTTGFWDWLKNGLHSANALGNLQYVAFGLGNRNYKNFNRVVRVVVEALDKHGAQRLLSLGEADDANGATEEDFLAWKDDLFQLFHAHFGLEEKPAGYTPIISIVEDDSLTAIDLFQGEPAHSRHNLKSSATCSPTRALTILDTEELFQSSQRNCVHMELDLSDHPDVAYKTGDHLAVWPTNPESEVDLLLEALGLRGREDTPISLKALEVDIKLSIPTPTTVRALFRRYLGICAPVSRTTVQSLAEFAPSSEAKSSLLQLGQSKDAYLDYLQKTHLTIGRLLTLISPSQSWSSLPLSYVVEALPHVQPRYYSISSSSVLSPRRVTLTALVAADVLPGDKEQIIKGVTSNYLLALSNLLIPKRADQTLSSSLYDLSAPADLLQGAKLYAHVRRSSFKLPLSPSCPIIMVAAGTGLAPFRAFIAERAKLHAIGKPIGEMILFFGCRRPDEDFIYRGELEKIQAAVGLPLFKIVTAYSRVEAQDKVYVQQRVREHGCELVDLIEEKGASFFICGRASMAREVGLALASTVKESKGCSDDAARDWSEGLKKTGKWREDVWG